MLAAREGRPVMVYYLLSMGANHLLSSDEQWTALTIAKDSKGYARGKQTINKYKRCIQLLKLAKDNKQKELIDYSFTNKKGKTVEFSQRIKSKKLELMD